MASEIRKLPLRDDIKTSEIARVVNLLIEGYITQMSHYPVLTAAPTSPQDGDLAFADGSTWNPGSGVGLYEYHSGAWNKL